VVSTVLLLLAAYITTYYWAEGLWFAELSFADEFWLRSLTQLGLGLFTLLTSLSICFFNLNLATRLQFNQNCLLPIRPTYKPD